MVGDCKKAFCSGASGWYIPGDEPIEFRGYFRESEPHYLWIIKDGGGEEKTSKLYYCYECSAAWALPMVWKALKEGDMDYELCLSQ